MNAINLTNPITNLTSSANSTSSTKSTKSINFNRFKTKSLGLTYKLLQDNSSILKNIKNKNFFQVILKVGINNIQEEKTLVGHTNKVTCLVKINENKLASGSVDNSIKIWDLSFNSCLATLIGHTSATSCLCYLKETNFSSICSLYFQ